MCRYVAYRSRTCGHRWLTVTQRCSPSAGFNTQPLHHFHGKQSLFGGMKYHDAAAGTCPNCDLYGQYDGNTIRIIIADGRSELRRARKNGYLDSMRGDLTTAMHMGFGTGGGSGGVGAGPQGGGMMGRPMPAASTMPFQAPTSNGCLPFYFETSPTVDQQMVVATSQPPQGFTHAGGSHALFTGTGVGVGMATTTRPSMGMGTGMGEQSGARSYGVGIDHGSPSKCILM